MKLINYIQILALTILTSSLSFAQTGPTATTTTNTITLPTGSTTTLTTTTTTNAKTGNTMEVVKQSVTNADGTVLSKSSSKSIIENNGPGSTIARSEKTPGGTATTTVGATGATAKK